MAGRKPTPTALRQVMGNPSGRPLPEAEPEVAPARFTAAPDYVKAQPYAEQVWNETMPMLIDMGTISMNDLRAFGQYCVACGIHQEATILMSQTGLTYESRTEGGGIISRKSPFIDVINTQARIAQAFASEFGLTPSARAKIGTVAKKRSGDPLDDFLN